MLSRLAWTAAWDTLHCTLPSGTSSWDSLLACKSVPFFLEAELKLHAFFLPAAGSMAALFGVWSREVCSHRLGVGEEKIGKTATEVYDGD